MSLFGEIVKGVFIVLIGSVIIILLSNFVKSKKLKVSLKKILRVIKKITIQHFVGLLYLMIGIWFIIMAVIVTESTSKLHQGNTDILGTNIKCDDNYKCFWNLEKEQYVYIPIKVKPNRILTLDLIYRSNPNFKLFYEFGNIKDLVVENKDSAKQVNLIKDKNSNDIKNFKNNTLSKILNFLDIFNTKIIWLKIKSTENIRIDQILYNHIAPIRTQNITIGIIGALFLIIGIIIILKGEKFMVKKRRKR